MNKANILVIDDEFEIRELCSKLLRQKYYHVESAKNGKEGLTMLHSNFFDLVLLDLKMPGINGLEVLKDIKKNNINTDTIILTGYATIETAVKAMRLGSYDYISKPFDLSHLNATVERCIKKRIAAKQIHPSIFTDTNYNLKTSINAIVDQTTFLLNNPNGQQISPQHQILNKININSKKLLQMINNLLDLSNITLNKMVPHWEKIKIKNILAEIIIEANPLLKEKNLAAKIHIDPNLPFIISDKSHIKQILTNIIDYTIKLSSPGQFIISILNVACKKTIKIGIIPLLINPLRKNFTFTPFKTAHQFSAHEYDEVTINLNLAKTLTESIGGTLEIKNISNNDFSFILTLPYQPTALQKETKKNILVIDINPAVIRRICNFTKETEYQVVGCLTKEEALKQPVHTNPFAIILDIMTAESEQGKILRDLKNNPKTMSIPIIVISSSKTKTLVFDWGNKNFIIKPIKKQDLFKELNKLKKEKGQL